MKKMKRLLCTILAAAMLLALAACGTTDGGGNTPSTGTPSTGDPGTSAPSRCYCAAGHLHHNSRDGGSCPGNR